MKRALVLPVLVVLFPFGCWIIARYDFAKRTLAVQLTEAVPPPAFPVVVFSPHQELGWNVAGMHLREISGYRAAHPAATFRVPDENEIDTLAEVHGAELVRSGETSWEGVIPGTCNFTVSETADGRQKFKVAHYVTDFTVNVGWYDITSDIIIPRQHQYYRGPATAIASAIWAFTRMLAVYAAGLALWTIVRFIRRRTITHAALIH